MVKIARETRLRWSSYLRHYVMLFILTTGGVVTAMHATTPPTLEAFRVPSDLRRTAGVWGIAWPESFDVYHVFICVLSFNLGALWLGLARIAERRWRYVCGFAAFMGGVCATLAGLYFSLQLVSDRTFSRLDVESAVIAAVYSAFWLVTDGVALLLCCMPQRERGPGCEGAR